VPLDYNSSAGRHTARCRVLGYSIARSALILTLCFASLAFDYQLQPKIINNWVQTLDSQEPSSTVSVCQLYLSVNCQLSTVKAPAKGFNLSRP